MPRSLNILVNKRYLMILSDILHSNYGGLFRHKLFLNVGLLYGRTAYAFGNATWLLLKKFDEKMFAESWRVAERGSMAVLTLESCSDELQLVKFNSFCLFDPVKIVLL